MIEVNFTPETLLEFGNYVKEWTGMAFDDYKWLGFKISLKERMNVCRLLNPRDYFSRLRSDAAEKEELISLLSVPETYFFRNKVQFDVLRDAILPEIAKKKIKAHSEKPLIRIVSAGCSTGEEPYSIAIAVLQSGLMEKFRFDIIAFDINKKALLRAERAEYPKYSFREKDTEFLADYFSRKGDRFLLHDNVRKMVKFHQANLFDLFETSFSFSNADVIFFRNVYIYFDQDDILKVLRTMEENLDPDGYLFLAPSESLSGRRTGFDVERINGAFVYRHKGKVVNKEASLPSSRSAPTSTKAVSAPMVRPVSMAPLKPRQVLPHETKPQEIHYENALGYVAIKQLDKGEEEFLQQLKLMPRHAKSLVGLAQIYADTGRDELAVATCKRAVDIDNLLTDSYFILGLVYYKRKEYPEALSCLKKTLYCNENHFLAQYYLGAVYNEMHKKQDAGKQFQVTVDIIQAMGQEGMCKEIAGVSGSYVLSLCMDSVLLPAIRKRNIGRG